MGHKDLRRYRRRLSPTRPDALWAALGEGRWHRGEAATGGQLSRQARPGCQPEGRWLGQAAAVLPARPSAHDFEPQTADASPQTGRAPELNAVAALRRAHNRLSSSAVPIRQRASASGSRSQRRPTAWQRRLRTSVIWSP
jgi:hypothetical protein